MYSTSELDELFQILNLIEKDLNLKELEPHWNSTTLVLSKMEDHFCLNPVFTKLIKRDALFCMHCQQVRMMSKSVMYIFYFFIVYMS